MEDFEFYFQVKDASCHPTEMSRLQSNFFGKLERRTRDPFPKGWKGYGCEFLAKQTIKFYSAFLREPQQQKPITPARRYRSPPPHDR